MASEMLKVITQKYNHVVGNLSSWKIRVLPYGALVEGADIDNFTLVELGFNAEGERICKQLSDVTKDSYLIAAPERRYIDGEPMSNFYNAVGEMARIVLLDRGVRFETSGYALNAGVTEVKNGQVAHFDPATKKFIISEEAAPHADFANASAKFVVVSNEEDLDYTLGAAMVKLEVVRA